MARDGLSVAEAAALLKSLAVNPPFVDGNKRIAFAAADAFLRINRSWELLLRAGASAAGSKLRRLEGTSQP